MMNVRNRKSWILGIVATCLTMVSTAAFAQSDPGNISSLASNISATFTPIINLIVSLCYLAGTGFTAASIFKFKAHKDNPTQIPIGTPITMLFVGIALLFLPAIVKDVMGSIGFSAGDAGNNYSKGNITGGSS